MFKNSCQLRAANVNSTLYRIRFAGKSLKKLYFPAGQSRPSALPLLVLLFAADHEQHALAPNDLAVTADFLD
jgi:hypothetical protein